MAAPDAPFIFDIIKKKHRFHHVLDALAGPNVGSHKECQELQNECHAARECSCEAENERHVAWECFPHPDVVNVYARSS